MKKLFSFIAMIMACLTVSAQFTNSNTGSGSTKSVSEGWSTFYVQYNPITIAIDQSNADDYSLNGISVGYNRAFNISQGLPLYIEAGIGATYAFGDITPDDEDDYETKMNMLSLKIPVSLMYDIQISNSNLSLAPFVGITARYNISGKQKTEYDSDYYEDVELDVFDKKDMGSKDATYGRFQLGWQIGVNAKFSDQFLLGISYGSDFSEICKDNKVSTTSITLGYCF